MLASSPSPKPGYTCAAISGALCPESTAGIESRVTVDFGGSDTYELGLTASGTGFDSTRAAWPR